MIETRTCSAERCYRPAHARGLCRTHYGRLRRYSTLEMDDPVREAFRPQDRPRPVPWCVCPEPIVGIISWFSDHYVERDPKPTDAVQCRRCQMPIREFMAA